jgi:hypothetical protein
MNPREATLLWEALKEWRLRLDDRVNVQNYADLQDRHAKIAGFRNADEAGEETRFVRLAGLNNTGE